MWRHLLILALAFSAWPTFADVGEDVVVSGKQQKLRDELDAKGGHSFAPVVGYEPVYSVVVGAAWMYETRRFSSGVDVNTNFRQVYQLHANFRHSLTADWEYGMKGGITRGFDPFYGEGGETNPNNYEKLWGTIGAVRAHLAFKPTDNLAIGVFADLRGRSEEPGREGSPAVGRRYPDETTMGLGIFQKVDTRDSKREPHEGFVFGTALTVVPGGFSTHAGRNTFALLEADFIVYKEVLDGVIPNVIAAFQLQAGTSFGDPSYPFGYRLGGANKLRGYVENRFRGKKYYLQQTELRFPIWKPLGGTLFIGFGDVTDGAFTNPKMAYGFGLTLGLPPDYVSKIRVDVGFGRDQRGVFADFGYVF